MAPTPDGLPGDHLGEESPQLPTRAASSAADTGLRPCIPPTELRPPEPEPLPEELSPDEPWPLSPTLLSECPWLSLASPPWVSPP